MTTPTTHRYAVDDPVMHRVYGQGIVKKIDPDDDQCTYKIKYENGIFSWALNTDLSPFAAPFKPEYGKEYQFSDNPDFIEMATYVLKYAWSDQSTGKHYSTHIPNEKGDGTLLYGWNHIRPIPAPEVDPPSLSVIICQVLHDYRTKEDYGIGTGMSDIMDAIDTHRPDKDRFEVIVKPPTKEEYYAYYGLPGVTAQDMRQWMIDNTKHRIELKGSNTPHP